MIARATLSDGRTDGRRLVRHGRLRGRMAVGWLLGDFWLAIGWLLAGYLSVVVWLLNGCSHWLAFE